MFPLYWVNDSILKAFRAKTPEVRQAWLQKVQFPYAYPTQREDMAIEIIEASAALMWYLFNGCEE